MSRMKEHVSAGFTELEPIRIGQPVPTSLVEALAAAQAEMRNPTFDKVNPHFKSKFASLAAVRDAVVPVLARHGIAMTQTYRVTDGFQTLVTVLHRGHERIESEVPLPAYQQPQQWASATTYIRRVSLMAIAGVCGDDDDDAEVAMDRDGRGRQGQQKPAAPDGFDDWWTDLGHTVEQGEEALSKFWMASDKALRAFVMHNHQELWNKMKAQAAAMSKARQ